MEKKCDTQMFRAVRTEYGRKMRKDYEAGAVSLRRGEIRRFLPKTDSISNTLTSVDKDTYMLVYGKEI